MSPKLFENKKNLKNAKYSLSQCDLFSAIRHELSQMCSAMSFVHCNFAICTIPHCKISAAPQIKWRMLVDSSFL